MLSHNAFLVFVNLVHVKLLPSTNAQLPNCRQHNSFPKQMGHPVQVLSRPVFQLRHRQPGGVGRRRRPGRLRPERRDRRLRRQAGRIHQTQGKFKMSLYEVILCPNN